MLSGLEAWGRTRTPESKHLIVCTNADSTEEICKRFLRCVRHKSGTKISVNVLEESHSSWQIEARDPSSAAYEEGGQRK